MATTSQLRSLLSITRLKSARSRWRPCLPLFQCLRGAGLSATGDWCSSMVCLVGWKTDQHVLTLAYAFDLTTAFGLILPPTGYDPSLPWLFATAARGDLGSTT